MGAFDRAELHTMRAALVAGTRLAGQADHDWLEGLRGDPERKHDEPLDRGRLNAELAAMTDEIQQLWKRVNRHERRKLRGILDRIRQLAGPELDHASGRRPADASDAHQ
jgi:hypothetical protein